MKTYICDICNEQLSNPIKRVFMRELTFKDNPFEKEKIHLCEKCWNEIRRKVRERSKTSAE